VTGIDCFADDGALPFALDERNILCDGVLAAVAARADRRIALAGMLNGKVANSHSFDVAGPATVIDATLNACGVTLPTE
jgi:hypothetical protein